MNNRILGLEWWECIEYERLSVFHLWRTIYDFYLQILIWAVKVNIAVWTPQQSLGCQLSAVLSHRHQSIRKLRRVGGYRISGIWRRIFLVNRIINDLNRLPLHVINIDPSPTFIRLHRRQPLNIFNLKRNSLAFKLILELLLGKCLNFLIGRITTFLGQDLVAGLRHRMQVFERGAVGLRGRAV